MDKYSLLIISQIPVKDINNEFYSLDLWCKDINTNNENVKTLGLICPISKKIEGNEEKCDSRIRIHGSEHSISLKRFESVIQEYDVVQIGAGRPFWQCRNEFLALFYAKKYGKCIIFSVSSNRVKLTLLNSEGNTYLKKFKQKIVALSIYFTQKLFSRYSDGVLLVGNGLKKALGINNKNIHIGLASWINKEDILLERVVQERLLNLPLSITPRLCICTRLEKMKGVHIAIEALAQLKSENNFRPILSIYGAGPEKQNLERITKELGLQEQVLFMGCVAYGETFFREIRQYDLMLLTNLSDEQPRLIFDSISQGVLPLCPNTPVYKSVGLDDEILYKRNSVADLAKTIWLFRDKTLFSDMVRSSRLLLKNSTMEQMHINRARWIKGVL